MQRSGSQSDLECCLFILALSGMNGAEPVAGHLTGKILDLSRFDAAPLIAFTVTKETDYGTETDGHARRWLMICVSACLH